jgi:DNA-binding transcriptional regulator YhcF (GntR family)
LNLEARSPTAIPSLREFHDFDRAYDGAFSLVAFIMNRHMIDHMLRSARLLVDGDFESLILWGVLAHQNAAHLMPPGMMPTVQLDASGRLPDAEQRIRPLLLRDLAAITGVPRETARRKLERLAAQGYVERSGRAWVVSSKRLEPELREFTRESIKRMLAAADEVRAALSATDRAVARRTAEGKAA